jgi:uncharacterized membrane protein YraQ (UPF0718 family)
MSNIIYDAIISGLYAVMDYLSAHVLTCLIPAFFIAGAIGAFVKKDTILNYFGPKVKKHVSISIASVSGGILAVCSCTILPLFAGIYKKGSGIGPATTFLYAGPAINVLAIIYTARMLGFGLGIARAVFAILMSIVIGLLMAVMFKSEDEEQKAKAKQSADIQLISGGENKPGWVLLTFFGLMIALLVVGASGLDWVPKLGIIYLLTIAIVILLIYYFQRDEVTDWGYEIWDLTKKIFPILIAGTFVVGVIAFFLPPETFTPYLGDNSLVSNFIASIIGAILYMPTLLEVPIVGTTFGYSEGMMAGGPALALLLAGPAVSLPNMIVLYRIIGAKMTSFYIVIVIIISTLVGFIYGNLIV